MGILLSATYTMKQQRLLLQSFIVILTVALVAALGELKVNFK